MIKIIASIMWLSVIIGLLIMCFFASSMGDQYMEQFELCEKETNGDLCERNICMRYNEEPVSTHMILECIEQLKKAEVNENGNN